MPAQHPLLPVLDQRIENALAGKHLPGILLDPQPRAHLQRQRQEDASRLGAGALVKVIPEVAVGQILPALRLENVAMVGIGLIVDFHQRMQLRQMVDWLRGVGIGKPDAVAGAESGVAIERDAEFPPEKLLIDDAAYGFIFLLHRRAGQPAIPRQAAAQALPADQKGRPRQGIQRRIAHQVDAVRIRPCAAPHPARVDHGHEDQTDGFELPMQHAVPMQTADQRAQIGEDDGRAYPFEAMKAAEKARDGNVRRRIAKGDYMNREFLIADIHLAGNLRVETTAALADDGFQFEQFGKFGVGHASQFRITLVDGIGRRRAGIGEALVTALKRAHNNCLLC